MAKKKTTAEKIEEVKDQKCCWPHCNKKNMMTIGLPLHVVQEDNSLKLEENVQLSAPFCKDHYMYGMSGFFTIIKQKDGNYTVNGPFEVFMIAEHVFNNFKLKAEAKKDTEKRMRDVKESCKKR